jgi:hypothetical protein
MPDAGYNVATFVSAHNVEASLSPPRAYDCALAHMRAPVAQLRNSLFQLVWITQLRVFSAPLLARLQRCNDDDLPLLQSWLQFALASTSTSTNLTALNIESDPALAINIQISEMLVDDGQQP